MKIPIDKTKRNAILKWLRQGRIETMDIPEMVPGYLEWNKWMAELEKERTQE